MLNRTTKTSSVILLTFLLGTVVLLVVGSGFLGSFFNRRKSNKYAHSWSEGVKPLAAPVSRDHKPNPPSHFWTLEVVQQFLAFKKLKKNDTVVLPTPGNRSTGNGSTEPSPEQRTPQKQGVLVMTITKIILFFRRHHDSNHHPHHLKAPKSIIPTLGKLGTFGMAKNQTTTTADFVSCKTCLNIVMILPLLVLGLIAMLCLIAYCSTVLSKLHTIFHTERSKEKSLKSEVGVDIKDTIPLYVSEVI